MHTLAGGMLSMQVTQFENADKGIFQSAAPQQADSQTHAQICIFLQVGCSTGHACHARLMHTLVVRWMPCSILGMTFLQGLSRDYQLE